MFKMLKIINYYCFNVTLGLLVMMGQAKIAWGSQGKVLYLNTTKANSAYEMSIQSEVPRETIVTLKVNHVNLDEVTINDQKFQKVTMENTTSTHEKGYPAVPKINRHIMIPVDGDVTLTVLKSSVQKISMPAILPSKGSILRNVDPETVAYSFSEFYNKQTISSFNTVYPQNLATISSPFFLRDIRGITLHINPIQYDIGRGEGIFVNELTLKITTKLRPGQVQRAPTFDAKEVVQGFDEIYQNNFVNYADQLRSYRKNFDEKGEHWVKEKGRLLVITHQDFVQGLKPLIQWKKQRGFEVSVATLEEAGTTAASIKSYIQQLHQKDARLAYVLIVGDAQQVPFYPGTAGNAAGQEADPMYGLTVGNDSFPDLIVGRISVQTQAELATVINKSIAYERNPDINGDWYSKASGIASNEGDPTDGERAEELRTMLKDWQYDTVDQFYDPNVILNNVTQSLNEGRGLINYIGHGSETNWVTSNLSNRDIDQLTNFGKYPIIVSVACVNGRFNYRGGDVFAERWLKAGTPAAPKGAVAIFASSTNQAWVPPTVGQKEIVNLLVHDRATSVGALMINGSIKVLEDGDTDAVQTFQTWHIFGDPTLQIRTKKPIPFEIVTPDSLSLDADELNLELGGPGFVDATLLSGDEIIAHATNDANSSSISLKFDHKKISSTRSVLLTVTGFNRVPLQKVLEVR